MNEIPLNEIKDIVERAQKGDKVAFARLYDAYFTPVYKYIYFRVSSKDEAEDLSQDVFLKAFSSFGRYRQSDAAPLAYFYTIARNTVIDFYRKGSTPLASEEDILNVRDETDSAEDVAIKSEARELMRKRIRMLNPDQQEVITLRFINELSTQEIAQIVRKSEEAVRQIQSRGLKQLREIYTYGKE